ncbi:MAG: hypothetical protein QOE61_4938, partial [Micromonosporaceae bacterium]|nr:hypothetical protein [Micromonosporaceae bacterium]
LAYFGTRGVWTVTTGGVEAARDAAGDVLLSFPVEDAPPADTPDDVGQLFELSAKASEATAAKFRAALWNVSWFPATAPPPTGLVGGISQRFGADTGVSDQVDDLITERRLLAVSAYTLSEEGWPSPVMNPGDRPAEWASFVLKAKMRSVQRIRRGPYYLQLDARHSEYGGVHETVGSNAGASVWARGKIIKGPLVDAPAGTVSAGGETSRSTAGSSATGEWLFLAEQQEDVAWYKVGADLAAEVSSSVDGVAGTVTRHGTMYLIVSRHDVMRFEELLAAALAGDNSKGVMAPDPGLVDRHPPVFLSHGAGSTIADVVAGAQLLVAEVARRVKALGYTGADHGVSGLFQVRNAAALFAHQLLRKLQAKYGATEVLASRAQLRSRKGIDFTDTRTVPGGREVLTVNVRLRHSNEVPRQRRIERERSDVYPVNQGSLGYSESQSPWASLRLRNDLRLSSISDSDWTDNIRVQTDHGGSSSLTSGTSHTTWRAHGHIYDGPHRALTYESEFVVTMSVRFEAEGTASGRPARIVRGMRPWQPTRNDGFVQPAQIRYHVPEPLTLTTPAPADRVKQIGLASHKMVRSRGPHLAFGLRRRRLTGQAPFSARELGPKVTLTPEDRFVEAIRFELIDDVVGQMLDANGVARDSVGRWQVKLFNRYVAVDLIRNGGQTIYQIRDDGKIYDDEAMVLIDLSAYNAWDAGGGDIELQALTGIDAEPALESDASGSYSHSLTVKPSEAEYAVPGGVAFPSFGPGFRKNFRSRAWGESVSQTSVAGAWLVHRKVPHRLMAADALLTVVVNFRRRGIAPATLNAVGQGITSGLIAMNPADGPAAAPILPVTTQPHPAGPDQDLRYRQVRIRSGLFFYRPTTPARVPPAPGIPRTLTATQLPAWTSVERLLTIAPAAGTSTDGPAGNPVVALAEELLARHAPHALTSSWHLQGNTIQTKVTAPATLESLLSLDSLAASLDTELAAGLIYHGVDSSTGSTNHTILVVNARRVADSQSPYEFQYSGEEEQAGRYIMRFNRKVNRTVRIYKPLSWRFFWNPWFMSGPLEIDHFGVAGLDSAHPRSQAHG